MDTYFILWVISQHCHSYFVVHIVLALNILSSFKLVLVIFSRISVTFEHFLVPQDAPGSSSNSSASALGSAFFPPRALIPITKNWY